MPGTNKAKKTKIKLIDMKTKQKKQATPKKKSQVSKSSTSKSNSRKRANNIEMGQPTESEYIDKRRTLDPLREELAELVGEANQRVRELRSNDLLLSRALSEAEQSRTEKYKEKFTDLFNVTPTMGRRELNREFARVEAFLGDYTSTVEGAYSFTSGFGRGLFGAQWRADGGGGYDPTRVTKEQADIVFNLYGRILANAGGWSFVMAHARNLSTSLIQYGSENIINQIFDMVKEQGDFVDEKSIIEKVGDNVDYMIEMSKNLAEQQRSGIRLNSVEDEQDYQDRIARHNWSIYRKGLKK